MLNVQVTDNIKDKKAPRQNKMIALTWDLLVYSISSTEIKIIQYNSKAVKFKSNIYKRDKEFKKKNLEHMN